MTRCHNAGISVVDVPSRGGGQPACSVTTRRKAPPVAEQRLTTLSDYVGVLRRRIWIVVVAVVVAVGARTLRVEPRDAGLQGDGAGAGRREQPSSQILTPGAKPSSSVIETDVANAAANAHTTPYARAMAPARVKALMAAQLLKETSISPEHDQYLCLVLGDRPVPEPRDDPRDRLRRDVRRGQQPGRPSPGSRTRSRSLQSADQESDAPSRRIAQAGHQSAAAGLITQLGAGHQAQGPVPERVREPVKRATPVTQKATSASRPGRTTTKNLVMDSASGS